MIDKKSKELGLFPQASKISTHEITDIEKEVKRISKPLFEDELDDDKKSIIAFEEIKKLLKDEPVDLTTIRRYFKHVNQNSKVNKLAISIVKKYPNLIHSFAYYVQRYPRVIPPSISNYIFQCCLEKTQQFASGILLEAIKGNLNNNDAKRFSELAKMQLQNDKKTPFIVDSRYKAQLFSFILKYDTSSFGKRRIRYVQESNWWVKSSFIYLAEKDSRINNLNKKILDEFISTDMPDLALSVANHYLLSGETQKLPQISSIAPVAQNMLRASGLITCNRYSNSQIKTSFSNRPKQ